MVFRICVWEQRRLPGYNGIKRRSTLLPRRASRSSRCPPHLWPRHSHFQLHREIVPIPTSANRRGRMISRLCRCFDVVCWYVITGPTECADWLFAQIIYVNDMHRCASQIYRANRQQWRIRGSIHSDAYPDRVYICTLSVVCNYSPFSLTVGLSSKLQTAIRFWHFFRNCLSVRLQRGQRSPCSA